MIQVKYTRGPESLFIGNVPFKRDVYREVDEETLKQTMLEQRKAEYGFTLKSEKNTRGSK